VAVALVMAVALLPRPALASETENAVIDLIPFDLFNGYVSLSIGDRGPDVMRLQSLLRDLGFYRGPITGDYEEMTASAVVTFHKYLRVERSATFNALDWLRADRMPAPHIPYRWDEPDRVEVDTTNQVVYVVRDHTIAGILPTSTGSGALYYSVRQGREVRSGTPHGDFQLYWRQYGWNCDSTTGWCVYNYWGFTQFYGIHGYGNVPAYPASHGCVRVQTWDSDWLDDYLFIGMPVHIWRELPQVEGPPPTGLPLIDRRV
jgi:hypothetical protein